ncbi:DHA2 family efflux MFS transporter permease subunit [Paenibacillus sp. MMS18-CY102]|uniref:DHA2 family efflux MFS transporter permease subunit n=1 Tax=Paenibacillus sp. MMS18-CY102 TaxID=2682849 RepID=UPI001365ED46|nr:DHA2 family efflux MFS transporter permease subunit [Paenibacillus sp. MMS18-CY102]
MNNLSKGRTALTFIGIILGYFIALLDTTIVNIALPKTAEYFNRDVSDISWVMNGYNIAFAVLMLTASRIADQFGRKKLFLIGLVLFALTSFLCGIASTLDLLILFRVLQGLSAAIIVPVTIPLAIQLFPKEKHGAVLGIWGAIAGVASASGPALGGILTEYFNWQSVYFVNLPIAIVSFIVSYLLLQESYDKTASKNMDFAGMLTISAAIFCFTLGLIETSDYGWRSLYVLSLFAASLLSLASFIVVERRSTDPMLPLSLLRSSTFNASSTALLFTSIGTSAGSFLIAFYLTSLRHMSVLEAGMTIIASSLTATVFSIVSGPLSEKIGGRLLASIGLAMITVTVYLFGGLDADSSRLDVMWRLSLLGAGLGISVVPLFGSAVNNIAADKLGIVSGVTNVARTLGMVVGVALLATMLSSNMKHELSIARDKAIQTIQASALDAPMKDGLITSIQSMNNESLQEGNAQQKMTLENVLEQVDQREQEALLQAPSQTQETKAAFEHNREQIKQLWPTINAEIRSDMAKGFSSTFHLVSFLLIPGIIIAFFSDQRRRQKANGETKAVISH